MVSPCRGVGCRLEYPLKTSELRANGRGVLRHSLRPALVLCNSLGSALLYQISVVVLKAASTGEPRIIYNMSPLLLPRRLAFNAQAADEEVQRLQYMLEQLENYDSQPLAKPPQGPFSMGPPRSRVTSARRTVPHIARKAMERPGTAPVSRK